MLRFLFLFLILVSCSKKHSESAAVLNTETLNEKRVGIMSWDAKLFPLQVVIGDAFVQTEIDAIQGALKSWEQSVPQVQFFKEPLVGENLILESIDDYDDDTLGIYLFSDWPQEFPSGALAVTQYFASDVLDENNQPVGINIDHFDIFINFDLYPFSTDPNSKTTYDLETVTLHETGHALGMGHVSFSIPSIMHPSLGMGEVNRSLAAHDASWMVNVYGQQNKSVPFSDSLPVKKLGKRRRYIHGFTKAFSLEKMLSLNQLQSEKSLVCHENHL